MDTNPFKVELNLKHGTIEVRDNVKDGSVRFAPMINETAPIISQMQAALRKAEFIMANPLMQISAVNEAVGTANETELLPTPEKSLKVMVSWYQHALRLFADIAAANRSNDYSALKTCLEITE